MAVVARARTHARQILPRRGSDCRQRDPGGRTDDRAAGSGSTRVCGRIDNLSYHQRTTQEEDQKAVMADTFTIIVAALLAGGLTLALMPMIVLEIRYRIDRHEIGKIIKRFKD